MEFKELTFIEDKSFIRIKHNDETLLFKTPIMRIPFGVKSLRYNNKINHNFQVSIDKTINDKSYKLLSFMENLEIYIKNKYKDNSLFKDKTFISRIYKGKNNPLLTIDLKKESKILCNSNPQNVNSYIDKSFISDISFFITGVYIGKTLWGLSLKCETINIKERSFKVLDFS